VRSDLPTGTVTFLFTDVEGSTKLLHELGEEAYAEELAEHRRIVREACVAEGGVEVDTQYAVAAEQALYAVRRLRVAAPRASAAMVQTMVTRTSSANHPPSALGLVARASAS